MNDVKLDEPSAISNFDTFPEMEIVKEGNVTEPDGVSATNPEAAETASENIATPTKSPTASNVRRARGLSLLPVRPGSSTSLSPVNNPSHSSSPNSAGLLSPHQLSPDANSRVSAQILTVTPPKSQPTTSSSPSPQRIRRASINGTLKNSSISRPPSHLDNSPLPVVDHNQHLLNSYFSELASRESRISMLKEKKAALEQQLADEEFAMLKFKRNGAKLAQIVSDEYGSDPVKLQQQQHTRSESTSSGNSYSSNTSNDETPADMFDAGRRVVAAMWSSLVKNIEPDSRPLDHQARYEPRDRPSSRSPHRSLVKKPSIAEFVRSRSQSPSKQERQEHAAQQTLRSSQRLTKKLSHVNLRSPHQLELESPTHHSLPAGPSRLVSSRQKP